MVAPLLAVAGGTSIVSSILSIIGGVKGGQAAEFAGRQQAGIEKRVTAEKLLILEQEERELAGETRARAAGSGVKADVGSVLTLLAEQARTFERERRFTRDVGAEKAKLAQTRGGMVASQVRTQAFGQAASTASNAFSIFAGG